MKGRPTFLRARRHVVLGLARFSRHEDTRLLVLAVVVGIMSALAAVLFWTLFDVVRWLTFGTRAESVLLNTSVIAWWLFLAVPTAGGLLIGLFVDFVMPGRRPHAVADVIEAVSARDGRMSMRTGLAAAAVSAASIGVGASVGREGPVVHLGATLGAWLGEWLKLDRSLLRTLLGCGVAAAVAASFNAPIAGAFFALEVVLGHYALRAFAPVVIASVTGTLVYRVHIGDMPTFIQPEHVIASLWEFPAFALLGVVSAAVALILMWSILSTQDWAQKLPVPPWSRPALAGLAVGALALVFPQVLGVGYASTNAAINQSLAPLLLFALIPAKIAATAVSLGAGFGGGVFSPALFVGAMTGGAFGVVATAAFPEVSSGHGAYALIGMGAVAAAVLNAPMSTILIVFELTGDYAATIAVMVAVVIASVITNQIVGGSFFIWQLRRRGVDLTSARRTRLLRPFRVRGLMDRTFQTVPQSAAAAEVRRLLQSAPHGELFVVDERGALTGTITFLDLRETAFDTDLDEDVSAADLARRDPPVLLVDDTLDRALDILEDRDEPHIPVVEDRDDRILVGIIHERDVVLALNRAIAEADHLAPRRHWKSGAQ